MSEDTSTERIAAIGKEFLQLSLSNMEDDEMKTKFERSAALAELHEYADDLLEIRRTIDGLHDKFEVSRREESTQECLDRNMTTWSAPALAELFEVMAKAVEFLSLWSESGLIYLCIRDPFNMKGWDLQKQVAQRILDMFKQIKEKNDSLSSFVDDNEMLKMDMLYIPEGWEVKQGVGKYASYKFVVYNGDDSKAFWLKRL